MIAELEQAREFVNRYPAMFTADKEWWAISIAEELVKAQRRTLQEMKKLTEEKV